MAKKILIVAPSWVGDLMMSQSLFKALKAKDPNCIIDVLAPKWCELLLSRMPEVERAITMPIGHGALKLLQRYKLGKSLKNNNYDQAIVLPNSWKSALIPFWASIRQRTGFIGECRWGLLNDVRKLDKQQLPLMVQRYLSLAYKKQEQLPKNISTLWPRLEPKPIELINNENKPILALCPGAAFGGAKQWPAKHFAAVANKKLQDNWQVWIFGSKNDLQFATKIDDLTDNKCKIYAGETSLAQAVDLLALADVVVSNDSGLMHIAAALDIKVIAIYGPTTSDFTPPLSKKAEIINLRLACSPCFKRECPLKHHDCMNNILPERVYEIINH